VGGSFKWGGKRQLRGPNSKEKRFLEGSAAGSEEEPTCVQNGDETIKLKATAKKLHAVSIQEEPSVMGG